MGICEGSIVRIFEEPACAGRRKNGAVEPHMRREFFANFSKPRNANSGSTALNPRLPAQAGPSNLKTIEPSAGYARKKNL
ncbi:hypothetical protein A2Y83_02080 [Candidatus Falkowbacteria bacterium RBG_13_39_14]|uniref:Uncharacterized protein n=1 Tax=Candidatus Falkowbacteria bacterium RBG_13_39_14 TaxID=1797985 RepID=A0A1F5S8D9_9BACT|nr:MAG: hypothetical protein A2Y83_02080 [Candidatus Falkowbacteria bacterium RBG_13_39_14]